MAGLGKYLSLYSVIMLACAILLLALPVHAQTIPEPSVPEFTVQITTHSIDTPTTHSTDPYTGETKTSPGSHTETKTLDIKITNQPFTPFESYGTENQVLYNIRYKGHYEDENSWKQLYHDYGFPAQNQSSDYTTFSFYTDGDSAYLTTFNSEMRVHGTVDFQVKAMIGQVTWSKDSLGSDCYSFFGKESAWSPTETFAFPGNLALTPNPTSLSSNATPSEPMSNTDSTLLPSLNSANLALTISLAAVVISVGCVVCLLLYVRRLKRSLQSVSNS